MTEAKRRGRRIAVLMNKPKRSQAEEHYYEEAKEEVARLSDAAKQVLRHLLTHGKLDAHSYAKVAGQTPQAVVDILVNEFAAAAGTHIVRKEVSHPPRVVWWEIVPGYRSVLGELLYPVKAD